MAALAQDEFESTVLSAPAAATCSSARDWTLPRAELHNTRCAEPNLARHVVVVEPCLENQLAQTTQSRTGDTEEGTGGVLQSCHTRDNGGSSSRVGCEESVLSASGLLQHTSLAKGIEPHHHQMQR